MLTTGMKYDGVKYEVSLIFLTLYKGYQIHKVIPDMLHPARLYLPGWYNPGKLWP